MRRLVIGLVPALLLLALSAGLPAPASGACTCTEDGVPEQVEKASAVFLGSVTAAARRPDVMQYGVRVERSFKGEQPARVELRSPLALDGCGLRLRTDQRYLVFGREQGSVIEVNRCGGTAPPDDALLSEVQALLGQGTTPSPSPTGSPSAEPSPAPSPSVGSATLTRVAGAEPEPFTRLAAPGAAAVIIGLLGLLVLGRVGRTR